VNYKSSDSIALANSRKKSKAFEVFNLNAKVNSLTIDKFCEINKISQIDLLKIDVQGA
jgi:FkbM family methyltransferase